ncbi:hypothetical protein NDU88_005487 [Pleurodeles waltl]|uniref:Uncharacterized protein n=1 Tax=Pleurodeles waltl TaxID=8319 RepID=A0AAV7L4Z5_PLEWA|nr:hypothetical protein NDU88_005487 [Pleurodeles waltl]
MWHAAFVHRVLRYEATALVPASRPLQGLNVACSIRSQSPPVCRPCNRASIAAVTNCSPEPAESYPGGTLWGIADPEVLSVPDIRDTETGNIRQEKPEGARADVSEEETRNGRKNEQRMEPEEEGGTKSEEEEDDRKDAGEGRRKPDSAGSLEEGPKTPTDIQRRYDQRCHVPGGARLTQGDSQEAHVERKEMDTDNGAGWALIQLRLHKWGVLASNVPDDGKRPAREPGRTGRDLAFARRAQQRGRHWTPGGLHRTLGEKKRDGTPPPPHQKQVRFPPEGGRAGQRRAKRKKISKYKIKSKQQRKQQQKKE